VNSPSIDLYRGQGPFRIKHAEHSEAGEVAGIAPVPGHDKCGLASIAGIRLDTFVEQNVIMCGFVVAVSLPRVDSGKIRAHLPIFKSVLKMRWTYEAYVVEVRLEGDVGLRHLHVDDEIVNVIRVEQRTLPGQNKLIQGALDRGPLPGPVGVRHVEFDPVRFAAVFDLQLQETGLRVGFFEIA